MSVNGAKTCAHLQIIPEVEFKDGLSVVVAFVCTFFVTNTSLVEVVLAVLVVLVVASVVDFRVVLKVVDDDGGGGSSSKQSLPKSGQQVYESVHSL